MVAYKLTTHVHTPPFQSGNSPVYIHSTQSHCSKENNAWHILKKTCIIHIIKTVPTYKINKGELNLISNFTCCKLQMLTVSVSNIYLRLHSLVSSK